MWEEVMSALGSVHIARQRGLGDSVPTLCPSLLLRYPLAQPKTIQHHGESPYGNQRLHLDGGWGGRVGALGSEGPVSPLDQMVLK